MDPADGSIGASDVLVVLDALAAARVSVSVGGGWGIDALLGRQTRRHADLDLAVDAADVPRALDALAPIGLPVVLDQLPARIVAGDGRRSVDLHPIRFDDDGTGRQPGLSGESFVYPPGSLDARGTIAGRPVRCCSPELQVEFHSGYDPRDIDCADMAALAERFGLRLPSPLDAAERARQCGRSSSSSAPSAGTGRPRRRSRPAG